MPKRNRSPGSPSPCPSSPPNQDSSQASKKLKLHSEYTLTSPFPTFSHPTPTECLEIHALLSAHHRIQPPVWRAPLSSANSGDTCGATPDVIDSLIGTILSQNTSNSNSASAKRSLDQAFGKGEEGWKKIAEAPRDQVVEAIKHGGLANKKAKTIQDVLGAVKQKHGVYSLQHLANPANEMSNSEIMQELISYSGVGPKTASCVLLFCLGRDSFAVDTHIFRLTKLLGWVPPKADRVLAQAHLDLKVPKELKYGLHVLFITHGRACAGCKGSGKGKGVCVLKGYAKDKGMQEGTEGRE